MFYYVDESGNTGKDLFNVSQPNLFYGLLTSNTNFDSLAKKHVDKIKQKYGITHLHGKNLPLNKIDTLTSDLIDLQKKYKLRFDCKRLINRTLFRHNDAG